MNIQLSIVELILPNEGSTMPKKTLLDILLQHHAIFRHNSFFFNLGGNGRCCATFYLEKCAESYAHI